ncbi:uncharacterized protein B4U80_04936 [Leptotrombidium deliense]|uniref:ATP-dependent DNA helicase n=1 Tax=Leptotrombidium deliense TaxID=299467 RepID=A0A443SCV5_9ACAR|nr:uncharacterized protein B4U80_04936 [Leptotrombidium deliense]
MSALWKRGRPKKFEGKEEAELRKRKETIQKREYERRNRVERTKRMRIARSDPENQTSRNNNCNAYYGKQKNVENISYFDHGDLSVKCIVCGGLTFVNEVGRSKHSCCHGGKITINSLRDYPDELKVLLCGNDETSKHFRDHIRIYNNAFAFASFNASYVNVKGTGPYCLKISGSVSAKVTTSLLGKSNPRYGQIYIYDDNEAAKFRLENKMREGIILLLQSILSENPYAQKYRQLYDVYQETNSTEVSLNFISLKTDDLRRYNLPNNHNIAAIIMNRDGAIPHSVDIKVFPIKTNESDFLNTSSHHADPMLFPLLFPLGEHGWSFTMKTEANKNISPLQYYSYRLTVREGRFNPILCSGRLTQQYIINCYLTVESQRLKYLRFNQQQLRSECYQGLVDHISNRAANASDNVRLGNILILPSTFQGSARAMQMLYHDAMAISRKIGRPDLFITMTCNPKWPEITRYLQTLPPSTTANDIPHFTCRIFYQKAMSLINDLESVFGKKRAFIYTIEFQKRGLPHMHLLVTLHRKLLTADDVDEYISAEIPDKAKYPSLWYKVVKHMLHGPHKNGLSCYDSVTNKCSKKFPKPFVEITDMTGPGYPKYRRRNNIEEMHTYNGKHNGKIVHVDNSMVVPYNPYLLMKYDCHMNVEYCHSVMGIKYIHKYIHKGHDRARIKVSNYSNLEDTTVVCDEIQDYVDSRYLSANECAWRIFELPLHGRSHAVERLPVHLPGSNRVLFEEGQEQEAVTKNCDTKLTAFFKLNKMDENANSIRYEDIPSYYCWINASKQWQKRKNQTSIVSRITSVSSKAVELFHLKLLLRRSVGVKQFNDLKIVNNIQYETFREAAVAFGLVTSDSEMADVLREACSTLMPSQLRHFFVYMLLGCENIDGKELWIQFKNYISEDIGENEALCSIGNILENENSSLSNYGLPAPELSQMMHVEIVDLEYHRRKHSEMYRMLNNDQMTAYNHIHDAIVGKSSHRCFYIDGPGGSGKTFLYKCIIHLAIVKRKSIYTLAWTGIAAILLPFGKTAHKSFQLPLNIEDNTTLFWNKKTKKLLLETDLFIWDEASMIPAAALESIDIALRDICKNDDPFGGKLMLLGGDFRQVLPVVKRAGIQQIINSTIKRSIIWDKFKCINLSKNMRACDDESNFEEWLLQIGDGKVKNLVVCDDHYCNDIVTKMYQNVEAPMMMSQAILTPRNDDVAMLNNKVMKLLKGEMYELFGIDYVTCRGSDSSDEFTELSYPQEYINTLTPSGFPPYKLMLKVGSIIMLIRNLCVTDGLCNERSQVEYLLAKY